MGKLTVRAIEAAKGRDAPYKLMDGKGLQLRVAPDGTKTWLVRYVVDGKERQYTLPKPYGNGEGLLSLESARAEAGNIRADAKKGIDHQQKIIDARAAEELARQREREEREALERRLTVRKLFDRWSEIELAGRRDQGAETKRGLEKDVLSAIGERYAEEITRADIMAILDAVKARKALDILTERRESQLKNQKKATAGSRKYSDSHKAKWQEIADQLSASLSKNRKAEIIAERLKLPSSAAHTIRKAIK